MRLGDEVRMSLKGLFSRPMETGFLILGIALGIGATATGLSLFLHTVKVGDDLVNLPQYREVIVKPGIDSENADAPAILVETTRPANFNSEDLKAVAEIPAASHAYLVRETEYRLGNVPAGGQGDQRQTTGAAGTATGGTASGAMAAAGTAGAAAASGQTGRTRNQTTGTAANATGAAIAGAAASGSNTVATAEGTFAAAGTAGGDRVFVQIGPGGDMPFDGGMPFGDFGGMPPDEAQAGTTGATATGTAAQSGAAGGETLPEMTEAQRAELQAMRTAMEEERQAMVSADVTISDPEPVLDELPGKQVSPAFFDAMKLQAAEGSLFTDAEATKRSRVLVLGSSIAKSLYEDGKSLGRQIIMNRQIYSIIGVLEPTGSDIDNFGFVPYYISVFAGRFNSISLHFMVADPANLDDAESQITQHFTQKYGIVSVSTPRRQAEEANSRNTRLAIIILFLAGSGFFIAVVNVSNILLSRTIRQFRNIGIHKALGASRMDIFRLYFLESSFLALGGMLVGIALTALLSIILKEQLTSGNMSPVGTVVGIVAATLITLLITLYPSFQASKVPAAQAVKME